MSNETQGQSNMQSDASNEVSNINSGGGAVIEGSVISGTFAGRDIININLAAPLKKLIERNELSIEESELLDAGYQNQGFVIADREQEPLFISAGTKRFADAAHDRAFKRLLSRELIRESNNRKLLPYILTDTGNNLVEGS